jgi:hypothetical protein
MNLPERNTMIASFGAFAVALAAALLTFPAGGARAADDGLDRLFGKRSNLPGCPSVDDVQAHQDTDDYPQRLAGW